MNEGEDYYDMGPLQLTAILVVMFLMGVAAGYLAFHC